jgi:hypothetical protein
MGTEVEPTVDAEKPKWFNRCDEAYGLLCLSVSPDLLFHKEASHPVKEASHPVSRYGTEGYSVS